MSEEIFTTINSAPWPAESQGDVIADLLRAKESFEFSLSMAGSVVKGQSCCCPSGYVEVVSHLSPQADRDRWRFDEATAILAEAQLGKILIGLRWCKACGESCWMLMDEALSIPPWPGIRP